MAESLALHFEKIGYDHYIALACTKDLCDRMHKSWPATAPPLSCAFSSEPFRSSPDNGLDTEWQRYQVLALIGERGYDAMLVESDFIVHHDIYPLLRAPPLDTAQIVALKAGHHADSAAIYLRGSKAQKDGAALWVVREARVLERANQLSPLVPSVLFRGRFHGQQRMTFVYFYSCVLRAGGQAQAHRLQRDAERHAEAQPPGNRRPRPGESTQWHRLDTRAHPAPR